MIPPDAPERLDAFFYEAFAEEAERLHHHAAGAGLRIGTTAHTIQELDRRARAIGRVVEILVEVNVSGEGTKSGVPIAEALPLVRAVAGFPNLAVRGLMTMPPWFDDPEEARPYFRALRELRDAVASESLDRVEMRELSMGMTGDFTVAVEEGATIVRIGRGIFGERPAR